MWCCFAHPTLSGNTSHSRFRAQRGTSYELLRLVTGCRLSLHSLAVATRTTAAQSLLARGRSPTPIQALALLVRQIPFAALAHRHKGLLLVELLSVGQASDSCCGSQFEYLPQFQLGQGAPRLQQL